MQIIMFAVMEDYFIWEDQIIFDWTLLPQILLIMVLNALLCSIFNGILVNRFKSVDTLKVSNDYRSCFWLLSWNLHSNRSSAIVCSNDYEMYPPTICCVSL